MSGTTRRYFGTDGIRARANAFPLVPDFVVRLGQAAADAFLARRGDSRTWPLVVIGKDTRQSCDMLEAAIAAGLTSRGIDVRLAGVIPTPAVAQLTREEGAAFGIVISASHNPFEDNGIKFFGPDGYKLDDALELEIESLVDTPDKSTYAGPVGRIAPLAHAPERYTAFIRASVGEDRELFRGLHLALDAANGAASETSLEILRSLGAKVSVFHHHPSGININLDCGCTHPEVIGALVRETGAAAGVAHDGDADRVLLCDEDGWMKPREQIKICQDLVKVDPRRTVDRGRCERLGQGHGIDLVEGGDPVARFPDRDGIVAAATFDRFHSHRVDSALAEAPEPMGRDPGFSHPGVGAGDEKSFRFHAPISARISAAMASASASMKAASLPSTSNRRSASVPE